MTRPSAIVAELVLVGFALSLALGPARADAASSKPASSTRPIEIAWAGSRLPITGLIDRMRRAWTRAT